MSKETDRRYKISEVRDALRKVADDLEFADPNITVDADTIQLGAYCWMRASNKEFIREFIKVSHITTVERASSPDDALITAQCGPLKLKIICPVVWVCDKTKVGEELVPKYEYKLKPELTGEKI